MFRLTGGKGDQGKIDGEKSSGRDSDHKKARRRDGERILNKQRGSPEIKKRGLKL